MAEQKYYGIYQGIVTNTKDPEKRGRIKIKCPRVLGAEVVSAWCDPCVNVAYDTGGDFCIPNNDEAVWVIFIEGDSNRPVWLGGWWQKDMTPLGNNYSNADKVRIISYADCTITLKEGKIVINVGEGKGDLIIEDKKVTIDEDLEVKNSIKSEEANIKNIKAKIVESDIFQTSEGVDLTKIIKSLEEKIKSLEEKVESLEQTENDTENNTE